MIAFDQGIPATTPAAVATCVDGDPELPNYPRKDRQSGEGRKSLSNVVLCILGILFIIPLLWFVFVSVSSNNTTWGINLSEVFSHLTVANFRAALSNGGALSLWNSLVISLVAMAVSTVAATLSAYALVRRRIPWRGPVLLIVLFLTGIPISIVVVPIYEIYVVLGWLSILPSALFLAVTSLPFQIWLLKNYIEALPVELEESALVERARTYQILWRIVIPLALPGFGAAAIFGFVNAWGSFIVPLVLISSSSQQPAPIAIYSFLGAAHVDYGAIAAFSVIYSLPVLLLYLGFSRLFKGGFVLAGGIRG